MVKGRKDNKHRILAEAIKEDPLLYNRSSCRKCGKFVEQPIEMDFDTWQSVKEEFRQEVCKG